MRRRLSLKAIALLLAIATLFSVLPLGIFATDKTEPLAPTSEELATVVVLHDGAQKSSVTLFEGGKETLTALVSGAQVTSRSWQIRTPNGDQWINIYGKSGETLDVTLALITSMLDAEGRAYLRHTVKTAENTFSSEPVEIVVAYKPLVEESASVPVYNAAPTAEEGDLAPLVSIVINYIFDNGGLAFEPYGASIAKGSSFTVTVTSPSVMGYEPFRRIDVIDEETGAIVDSDYVSAKTVVIDIASVEEDLTINVIYEPAIVKFTVHHHLQDLTDDAYSMQADYRTTGYGLTGSLVPANLEMDIPGFKSLSYDASITIAADGSTVVEIRYDRIYYLVTFDMAGGYGTDPVYTRYGSKIGANPPTRHGYVFDGWELVSYGGETPTDAQKSACDINGNGKTITLPDASLTYRAKWITQLTTYTMVFWKENINDTGFTYWGYLDNLPAMSGTVVDGEDRIDEVDGIDEEKYFTYCDALTDKDVIVEGDGSTVVNVYYTRNRYSITFKATGKCVIEENHTHTHEKCYVTLCGESHEHSDACNPKLTCTTPVHEAHTDACIICGIVAHEHTDACYCGKAEHTHTKECWPNVGNSANKPARAPSNPTDGQIYRSGSSFYATYYIYIKGTWYRYNGTGVSNNTVVDTSCGYDEEHTHESSCLSCGHDSEHVHSEKCYKDTLHTHVETCYKYSCGKEAHEHSNACYLLNCGIPTGHSHSTNCNSSTKTNTVKIVYKKYQQDISDIWPIVDDNGVKYDSGERWEPSADSDLYSAVLVFIANMPPENLTLTLNESTAPTYTMNYYLEVLPGQAYTHTYEGRNYVLYTTIKANYNYITKAEDFFDINGYTQLTSNPKFASNGQIKINTNDKNVNFYYGRKVDHALEFSNNGSVLSQNTVTGIMYDMPLLEYYFEPAYPSNLEEGAYVFGGWYTSPGCFDGTEVDWDTLTMPAGGILLYAKWAPIVHTVEIYTSYTNGEYKDKIGDTQYINHNYFAHSPEKNPTNGNYVFQGWFYIDEVDGKEKAFVFTGIPIDQDMKIYAKWSSRITVSYKINYVLRIGGTEIAQSEVGQAIAGDNKTFYAKVDQELYEGYRTGFYPMTSSHTVTMSAEQPMHEYTFEYVYVESMPYAVRYVDENGNLLLETKRVLNNTLSVVTETFVKVSKMMPDAYQKRLILSANGEDLDGDNILDNNVITFRYVADEKNAYYKVVHYIQNIAGDGYREYRSEENKGVIGTDYVFTPITITGFAFNAAKALLNGNTVEVSTGNQVVAKLGEDGMLVELYYDRVNVNYTVNYLESGTNKVLYTQKIGTGIFGGQVAERAPGLTHLGYTLVGDELKQLHLASNAEMNIINFYYEESIYSLKYQIVGSEGGGGLSIGSENVNAVSGQPNGSTPRINKGYKFMGWFLDEACSRPVPEAWVNPTTLQLIPQSGGVWTANATYYARIIPDVSTLTITSAGAADIDEGQVFIYRIQGVSANVADIDITVTITGNGSVTIADLEIGDYTVTAMTDWSFRYEVANETKEISLAVDGKQNVINYGQVRSIRQWIDGNHSITNLFK